MLEGRLALAAPAHDASRVDAWQLSQCMTAVGRESLPALVPSRGPRRCVCAAHVQGMTMSTFGASIAIDPRKSTATARSPRRHCTSFGTAPGGIAPAPIAPAMNEARMDTTTVRVAQPMIRLLSRIWFFFGEERVRVSRSTPSARRRNLPLSKGLGQPISEIGDDGQCLHAEQLTSTRRGAIR